MKQTILPCLSCLLVAVGVSCAFAGSSPPNVIIILSDDQGWADTGYNGHPVLRTPNLDQLARDGIRLDRFYAAAPVCSPTRGSILTGRHPSRYGINWAYEGRLPQEEITLAEVMREAGYQTGHFGKWHLGQLSRTLQQGSRGGAHEPSPERYSPPWDHGFTTCFSTSGRVPTYNPYHYARGEEGRFPVGIIPSSGEHSLDPADRWPENYWTGPGTFIDEVLTGENSEIIMDRVLDFIGSGEPPFIACIWFHTPHTPVVAGPEWRESYGDLSIEEQHWYGAIEAMDHQIGRLLRTLSERGLADNTILWFCSDNGPSYAHPFGSAGPFSGRKGSLLEGGIRVPAIVHWPGVLEGGRSVTAPLSTSDMLPTLTALANTGFAATMELDGADISSLLTGQAEQRPDPVFFHSPMKKADNPWADHERFQAAVQFGDYKLLTLDSGETWRLHDLQDDIREREDVSARHPGLVESLKDQYTRWRQSCNASATGRDYLSPERD
jgi:arylsulfatase A-like enzyme